MTSPLLFISSYFFTLHLETIFVPAVSSPRPRAGFRCFVDLADFGVASPYMKLSSGISMALRSPNFIDLR